MMNRDQRVKGVVAVLALLVVGTALWAAPARAAGAPNWMPNFPMRMGAAGVMGMWMPVPGAAEYKVFRQVGSGAWEQIYKGPMNNFQDPAAPADQDVSYKVVAVVGGADSDPSPVAKLAGQKPVEPPKNLTSRLDRNNKAVHLRWGLAQGASFYNVYRADSPDAAGNLLGSVQEPKLTDPKVEDGKTYWYFVTSVGTTGQESKRAEPLEVAVKFPKLAVVKKFDFNPIVMKLVTTTQGEEFAEFRNPTDILLLNGRLYVACEDGVQILDPDGSYVGRMPLVQEQVAAGEWKRPSRMGRSDAGNILFSFLGEATIREITADGAGLVREIQPPQMPGHPSGPGPVGVAAGPGGTLWVTDGNYAVIEVFPGDAKGPVPADAVRWIGFPRATSEKYDPKKHGDRFIAPSRIRFLPELGGQVFVQESGEGRLAAVDPETGKKVFTILGIGAGRNQVSLLSDFVPYDETSVLIADSLRGEIKQIKVTQEGDDTNGDYLANLVDDPDGKKPKLQSMQSNVNVLQFDPKKRRLYALSVQGKELAIYDLP